MSFYPRVEPVSILEVVTLTNKAHTQQRSEAKNLLSAKEIDELVSQVNIDLKWRATFGHTMTIFRYPFPRHLSTNDYILYAVREVIQQSYPTYTIKVERGLDKNAIIHLDWSKHVPDVKQE